ncbi:Uma2 family endonuclease [Pueribacillus theae]|uniref:Uma2 family endonuclease n=2 Tax=Pueribacillus theae TaxID=2171751 RepID=A0A2U1JRJ9_9BACI|nr:Uma2 family endonuclease [Pueribacillus theae]
MSMNYPDKQYSYKDYLCWTGEERIELIDGIPYNMPPAPSRQHQKILGKIFWEFQNYLRDKECEVYVSPFDVRLLSEDKADNEVKDVVQPDVSVICDKNKLDEKGCNGSPDLIVEILSPATAKHDRLRKYNLYEKAQVKEYWIVDPVNETIEKFILTDETFARDGVFGKSDTIESHIFTDFKIDLYNIFSESD